MVESPIVRLVQLCETSEKESNKENGVLFAKGKKTKLEDARVLNSNTERERERERAMLCRMRKVTEREACVCVYICRENRNFGVVVVVK